MNPSDIRRDYAAGPDLLEETAGDDPYALFAGWFADALAVSRDANAMTLATVSADGTPAARTVLLKGFDASGFMFFTNCDSPKGEHLANNPRAALLFFWPELERQVRVTGQTTRVSREEAEKYFHSRPFESQVAAAVSKQSSVITDRRTFREQFETMKKQYEGQVVPMPQSWGGYRLAPSEFEFWQGRPSRLHDRLRYTREANGSWSRVRLAP